MFAWPINRKMSASRPLSKNDHKAHSMTALSLARTRYAKARSCLASFELSECDERTNAGPTRPLVEISESRRILLG